MSNDTTTECLLFPEIFSKQVVAQFDEQQGSSDGGAVLLKAAEGRYALITGLAACLIDPRQAGKIEHSLEELLAQRIFGIACGYADGNDAARLGSDPIHKMLLGRNPIAGRDLASQPTLSRFENAVGLKDLYRMGDTIAEAVLQRHAQRLEGRVKRITIDLDPTDDPTHGAQQLTFFNSHYENWCYLPVIGLLSFNDETEQYLCAAVLRPGNAPASRGAIGILHRLFEKLHRFFPQARIRVRLDGGFAHPQLFDFLEAFPKVEYVVAMAKNAVLKRKAKLAMRQAKKLARQSQQTEHVYSEAWYAAQSWPAQRRVIIKAEWVYSPGKKPKENPRFLITNMQQSPQWIYEEVYCQRGDIENRIRELHELEIDRTSCCSLGESVPRPAHRCRLYPDARAPAQCSPHGVRPRSSRNTEITLVEAGRTGRRFGPPSGGSPSGIVSFSACFSKCRPCTWSCGRVGSIYFQTNRGPPTLAPTFLSSVPCCPLCLCNDPIYRPA